MRVFAWGDIFARGFALAFSRSQAGTMPLHLQGITGTTFIELTLFGAGLLHECDFRIGVRAERVCPIM